MINFNTKFAIKIYLIALLIVITTNAIGAEICVKTPTSSLVVNVKSKGAKGNGTTDDTAAIQSAIDQVSGTGGTVWIPAGTYLIDAIVSIRIKKSMTLRMSKKTILKAIPNNKEGYNIIIIKDTTNVNIIDGTLLGDREVHSGVTGEWGMGISLLNASSTSIIGVTVRNCWGDGFYISQKSKNIKICSVIADNNRRQGMSIISVDGMIVKNSVFKNTTGTAPQAGIDLEPNEGDTIRNVQLLNSKIMDNKGAGIMIFQKPQHNIVNNITIDGNIINNNYIGGIAIYNGAKHTIVNDQLNDELGYGISLFSGTKGNKIIQNIELVR